MRKSAHAAVLTPDGRGAIAVVRVWGRAALEVADRAFRPLRGPGLAETPPGRLRLGRMGAGLGDEVVAVRLPGERPEIEVQCHGGPAPLALVLDALVAAGAERARPEDWARQAARSRLAAEAAIDLARAPTVRVAEILLDQTQGALEAEVRGVILLLGKDPVQAAARLEALMARATIGRRLVEGWRIVLAGRPNVGKSRLLNALAGYERAIVAPVPGTTRDIITVRTALGGWPVELADTAGLRPAADPIEAAGVALARSQHEAADVLLLVLDRSEPLTGADCDLLRAFPEALVVANKSDLPAAWGPSASGWLTVSAERGDGIDGLIAALTRRLVPEPPPPGAGVPFREEQVRHLEEARRLLIAGYPEEARRQLDHLLAD